MEATSGTTKILEKGPEYLRKQMERESETKGGMSAVERLAASKLKYVKSNSNRGGNLVIGSNSRAATCDPQNTSSPGQVRRSSSKKRPDSLLLYRHKCELLRTSANDRKHHITRRLLPSSVHKSVPLPEATEKQCEGECNKERITTPEGIAKECIPEFERSGKGVSRSHSDISSRYSKHFADFDVFFKYCGLGGEVIESLGKENFSARSDEIAIKTRSVSVSTLDNGFSRNSGHSDGLLEDELHEKMRQGTSVIERNARIIKWLYSCKNAIETGKKLRDLD
uniref:Family with sequence similarity 110 member C n=1 Tax=Cyclopterus lumpus TaxID=8103 RepID=A0A8C2XSK3_CYCLU